MATQSAVFLEVLEWLDATGREIVHRIPEEGSGEIKYGASLTVRESQAAVFFYQGKAYDAFGPGRHWLKTANLPILTKILSLPWGTTSPLRAEVVFVNMKVFPDLKWGTRDPVAFKDSKLGLVRLRAFGVFNIRIVQPVLFVNGLAGTMGSFTSDDIENYLNRVIVSRFNDHMGEHLDSLLNLPGTYEKLSEGLVLRLQRDFSQFGIALSNLYINSITPPPEVQSAIDDRSRLGVFDDLGQLARMKAAMAIEKAAESTGQAGAGTGMAFGMALPAMFAGAFGGRASGCVAGDQAVNGLVGDRVSGDAAAEQSPSGAVAETGACEKCRHALPANAHFCPACGHQIVVHDRCQSCGRNVPPGAAFCPRCGVPVGATPATRTCPHCQTENLARSVFCNHCGERISPA